MPKVMLERSSVPVERIARLTVDDYHRLIETGVLPEGAQIELLDGLLVYKDRSAGGKDPMSIGELHNLIIKLLARLDARLTPFDCHMQTQGPVSMPPYNEPEPDGAIVKGDPRDYTERLPTAADVFCVIEVADSSLPFDRKTKLARYAAAGIPQYVIVNLPELRIEVYEKPRAAEGRYAQHETIKKGRALELVVGERKRLTISVNEILP